ncbi:MAG: BlaI/MecI/CopY family transcriptional regulator [Paenibacillus macerans]|uniref:Penicillinase repressor family protein n=2 Tax=Paenibacillus TaxID=44249 RepID=A0A090Z4J5_PAEMA|nr:BlaI/MecI/CopY family transcriptional regulator [Paenibacillus macerans]KFN05557.1 penicillinase repressor family protein [Paenibacillus macerans]MCY7560116.1 BlaI/MecI/CopY family transcriptional regulator [Paenibacillus macerans]MDU7477438.1 BlaI/MecI/CopY family transcriptional regulator [Paenibacillus macerans]MEC0153050.1 BlaI/MecI/CopY family transcriptional regulator [Paenibacillus macerans]MEC0328392.1 BlaI/MecI/CopY family transcriptional regulator [Paenibacillus macerans]
MSQIPRISEAEWEVMKVFWQSSPASANDVIEALSDDKDWKPATVKTLINRLLKKKALGFHKEGKTYLYSPLVTEEECIRAESKSFLKRLYGGALKPMFVQFLKEERLTEEEIKELKQILDEKTDRQ